MPRLPSALPRTLLRTSHLHPSPSSRTPFSTTTAFLKEGPSESSTPGWKGRPTSDHVVHRTDKHDVQSQSSQQAMTDKDAGKEGSQGISEKDEGNFNEKAKKDTKAPGPVIGMNDERGGKGR